MGNIFFKKKLWEFLAVQKLCLPLHRNCENSSVGRAQPCQGWGRGFESRFSLKENNEIEPLFFRDV